MSRAVSVQRLLLIDSNDESRSANTIAFRALGWEVEHAHDLHSAIDVASARQPHVIVTELTLPDVRGLQFARTLRSMIEDDVWLVAMTASRELFEQASAAGFDFVFDKPLDPATVDRHVRARRS